MAGAARMGRTGRRSGLAHMPQVDHAQPVGGSRLEALERIEGAGRDHPARRRLFHGRGLALLRLVTDVVMVGLGTATAVLGAPAPQTGGEAVGLVWLFPPLVLALMAAWGLYRDSIQLRRLEGIGQVLAATSLAAVALIAAVALVYPGADPAPLVGRAWLFGTLYLVAARLLLGWAHRRARLTRLAARPTLIIGAGEVGAHVERRLLAQPELGLYPVGYLDSDPPAGEQRRTPVLGPPAELARVARETGAEHVVLGFSSTPDQRLIPLVRECEALGLKVSLVPRLFEFVNVHVSLEHLGGLPLFGLHAIDPKGWQFDVKHVLDRLGAAALLLLFSPLLVGLALAVRLSSPGPITFRQRRIGRDGRNFELLKFRSMRPIEAIADPNDQDNVVQLHPDVAPGGVEGADRRTWVGRLLRRTSLDELPQLINVLRGDMSLVGPRPERPELVELFGNRIARYTDRHRVKSGITGWAQVHGLRGKTSLADRVEWDNYYIENWSLGLDLKILLMTAAAVLQRAE
jgi:exopolysaccharide biosynthesis polyprenyl glycosylphosphotransferase